MYKNLYKIFLFFFIAIVSGNSFAQTMPLFGDKADGRRTLLHHMPKEVSTSALISHADPDQTLNLSIILQLQNQTQLSSLLKSIYDPTNPNFHHYLTHVQFTQQFGASQIDYIEAAQFLRSKGLSVSRNGFVLNVLGPVRAVEQAFEVHINNYQKSDGTLFYAPDSDPTIPSQVKFLAIGGLDSLPHFKSFAHKGSALSRISPQAGTGPCGSDFPSGSKCLAPADILKAYNFTTVPSNGAGQAVALVEFDGYLKSDIDFFDNYFNLSHVPLKNIYIDGFDGTPGTTSGEDTLDIEMLNGIAPGLQSIIVYMASFSNQGWVDEWNRIASDDSAKVISCSWGGPEPDNVAIIGFDTAIFQQLAAQGQEVFVASGDDGAYDGHNTLSALEPATQPYATGVGISALTINTNGTYQNETASTRGGGGISTFESIPSYQQGMISPASLGSTTMRNVPDVALTADPSATYSIYASGEWEDWWGSSIAAPIWAAFAAIVNEGREDAGKTPLGFINPALYTIARSNAYTTDFHDIISGTNSYYPEAQSYDDATGLGSFNAANLYNYLVSELLPPASLNATANVASVILSWSTSPGAASYNVKRSASLAGPYTTIASGITTTNYTDMSVLTGNTYYYEVSAVNGTVESGNSAAISVTPGPARIITASVIGGTIAPLGAVSVNNGSSQTFIFSSHTGYTAYQVLVDGVAQIPTFSSNNTYTYTFNKVTANHTLQVNFNLATITVGAGPGGKVSPLGINTVASGQGLIITITPASEYIINHVFVDSNDISVPYQDIQPLSYTFNNVTSNHTVQVYFSKICIVNASATAGGSIDPSGPTIEYPENPGFFRITTPSNSGYNLVELLWDGSPVTLPAPELFQGQIIYNYASPVVTSDHTLQAIFSQPGTYPLSVTAVNGTVAQSVNGVASSGPYNKGTVVTLTATPAMGFQFSSWSGAVIGTSNPTTVTMNSYESVTANFIVKPSIPAAPTGLSASSLSTSSGNQRVSLSWNASTEAASYNVLRSTVNGTSFTILKSGVTGTSYADTTVIDQTTYYYVVQAVDAAGTSPNSAQVSVTPWPTNLTATTGNTQVLLTWTASMGAISYNVYRSTIYSGPYTTIASSITKTNYTDTSVVNGTTYYYFVEVLYTGQQIGSSIVSSTPEGPTVTYTLSVTAANGTVARSVNGVTYSGPYNKGTVVTLTATPVTGYQFGSWSGSATGTSNPTTLTMNANESVTANFTLKPSAPPTPTGLKAIGGIGQVVLSWNASAGAINYIVERSTVSGGPYDCTYNNCRALGGNTTYTDTLVNNGTSYYYVVQASNKYAWSPNSAQVRATPQAP